jgi:ferredoxin-NADP reductase
VAGAALLERLTVAPAPVVWRIATVVELVPEAPGVVTIVLDLRGWPGHVAGQHVDVRLTAEDGYQAQRSYSIASAPEDPRLWLTVERIDDGEVSPYLADELRAGDELELRGPVGGHFVWRADDGGPLLLVAGGSGLVPLMAMLRHRAARRSSADARLLVSARGWDDLIYREALAELDDVRVHVTLTREPPAGWTGSARRVDAEMLRELGPPAEEAPRIYVCGPTAFVERAADLLVELGHAPSAIRAERFGPTGS